MSDKRQNQLTDDHIDKIIDTYQFRKEEHRYARRVSMEEIEKNEVGGAAVFTAFIQVGAGILNNAVMSG